MTDNSNYIPSNDSQNEYSSDEVVEIIQIPKLSTKKKKKNQEKESELAIQTLTPIEQSTTQSSKSKSWIWNYFIKKLSEQDELHAYCQIEMKSGVKCTKSYKHDRSTGNLISHIISKHKITSLTENITYELKSKSIQFIHKNEQKEKEESLLR